MTKTQFNRQTTIAPLTFSNVTPIEWDVFDTIPAAAHPPLGLGDGQRLPLHVASRGEIV